MAVVDQPCPVQEVAGIVEEGQEQLCVEKEILGHMYQSYIFTTLIGVVLPKQKVFTLGIAGVLTRTQEVDSTY